jgi:hypothetical protein
MTAGYLPLIALVALAVALTQARAAPLDADTCAKLQTEQAQLESAGVEKDMTKGPVWAKANLGLERMQRVQRFIEIEEQLLFRCRSKAIVHLAPETEAATGNRADQDKDDENDDDKASTAKAKPAAQPAAKPAAGASKRQGSGTAKKPPARAAARESAEPGVTTIQKRPPKAKVDDAFKVPPADPRSIRSPPSSGRQRRSRIRKQARFAGPVKVPGAAAVCSRSARPGR